MKKRLAILLLLSILSMGMAGALSVVPHVHGEDWNHSENTACPIYQAGIQGLDAVVTVFFSALVLWVVVFLLFFTKQPVTVFSYWVFCVLAPPVSL